eukprot:2452050-Pyramimonas_sp.AAC.1
MTGAARTAWGAGGGLTVGGGRAQRLLGEAPSSRTKGLSLPAEKEAMGGSDWGDARKHDSSTRETGSSARRIYSKVFEGFGAAGR